MKTRLAAINLIEALQQDGGADLMTRMNVVSHPAGRLIYLPEDEEDVVFLVKEGSLRLYLAMEDKEFTLAILEPGDIYITHTRAHVRAISEVTLLVQSTSVFCQQLSAYPPLSAMVIANLGEMLKQSFTIIHGLVFKDITGRIIDLFLHEAERSGVATQAGIEFELDLTMEDLAAVVGSSRQTVSRIISSMQRAGVLIRLNRSTYLLPDRQDLVAFPSP